MGETFGYTLSVIVAGVILLIISTMTIRGHEATVTTMQFSSAKQNTIDLVGVMDRDFRNLGSNFPFPAIQSELAIINYDTASTTHRFDFLAQTVRGQLPDTVSYRWTENGTVESDGITYPRFDVERYVNNELTGRNSGIVTAISIELKDENGDPIFVGSATRQIVVDLRMISSLGSNGAIREARWSETFHPMHMAKQDGINP